MQRNSNKSDSVSFLSLTPAFLFSQINQNKVLLTINSLHIDKYEQRLSSTNLIYGCSLNFSWQCHLTDHLFHLRSVERKKWYQIKRKQLHLLIYLSRSLHQLCFMYFQLFRLWLLPISNSNTTYCTKVSITLLIGSWIERLCEMCRQCCKLSLLFSFFPPLSFHAIPQLDLPLSIVHKS